MRSGQCMPMAWSNERISSLLIDNEDAESASDCPNTMLNSIRAIFYVV